MAWKKGPLPAGSYNWGGVILQSPGHAMPTICGFHFADFCGDHALLKYEDSKRVEAWEIAFYDNDLCAPTKKELEAL